MSKHQPTVVFDYGNVLVHSPQETTVSAMARLAGLDREQFLQRYQARRHDHDRGTLDDRAYWRTIVNGDTSDAVVEALIELDVYAWTVPNTPILNWIADLKAAGIPMAILSNMPAHSADRYEAMFDWLQLIEVRVFSGRLGLLKPEAEIYHELLRQIGREPADTIFLDDLPHNVDGARAVGIDAVSYISTTGAEGLRAIAAARGLPAPRD